MGQARRAIEACLRACSPEDQVGLVAFDHNIETFSPHLQPATHEFRDRAQLWLDALYACGGTHLLTGFHTAANLLGSEGSDLLMLTDGQVAGTENILAALPPRLIRLHVLGTGSAGPDRFLS